MTADRADRNRALMPITARVVDQLRAVFGPVRVVFAEEGGRRLGEPPDDAADNPATYTHPPAATGVATQEANCGQS